MNLAGMVAVVIVVMGLASSDANANGALAPGQWELSSDGKSFSLNSNRAEIKELLEAIRELSPADFHIRSIQDQVVSVRCFNVTLDELLHRLGLSFVLMYERESGSDEYTLSSGWISDAKGAPSTQPSPFNAAPTVTVGSRGIVSIPETARTMLTDVNAGESYRAAFPITIRLDGDVRDWPDGIPRQFVDSSMIAGGPAPTNDADASFSIAGVADDDYLYLAIDITDDMKAATNAAGLALVDDDFVRVLIRPVGVESDPLKVTINRHHVFTGDRANVSGLNVASRQYVSFNNGARATIIDDKKGWRMEVAVPFSSLGETKPPTGEWQFNVLLNDSDHHDIAPSVLSWNRSGSIGPGSAHMPALGTLRVLDIR